MVDTFVTDEENEKRFRECLYLIHNITREELIELLGEEFLKNYKRQFS